MNKSTFILCAILCAGLASSSHAQAVKPTTHETALAATQREFKAESYEAATKNAGELLAVAASPEEVGEARMLLGETYYRRKMYGEAQMQWAKMLELPDNSEDVSHAFAHLGYARSYSAQGQFDKAAPEYKIVIESFKEHMTDYNAAKSKQLLAPFAFALANAYAANKQYDLAQEQLEQVIQYNAGDSGYRLLALVKRGEVDTIQRDFKGALDSFNQALTLGGASQFSENGEIKILIPLLESLIKSQVGVGQANYEKLKIEVVPSPKFAEASNTISQLLLDGLMTEYFIDSPEE